MDGTGSCARSAATGSSVARLSKPKQRRPRADVQTIRPPRQVRQHPPSYALRISRCRVALPQTESSARPTCTVRNSHPTTAPSPRATRAIASHRHLTLPSPAPSANHTTARSHRPAPRLLSGPTRAVRHAPPPTSATKQRSHAIAVRRHGRSGPPPLATRPSILATRRGSHRTPGSAGARRPPRESNPLVCALRCNR